jgi:hypothetical protein
VTARTSRSDNPGYYRKSGRTDWRRIASRTSLAALAGMIAYVALTR